MTFGELDGCGEAGVTTGPGAPSPSTELYMCAERDLDLEYSTAMVVDGERVVVGAKAAEKLGINK